MSATTPPWVMEVDYYACMAAEMSGLLGRIIETNLVPGDLPKGVLTGACEFLTLALQEAHEEYPRNRLASLKAYLIAASIIRRSFNPSSPTWKDIQERLECYDTLVKQLPIISRLSPSEVDTANELLRFFNKLAVKGEMEVYDRVMGG